MIEVREHVYCREVDRYGNMDKQTACLTKNVHLVALQTDPDIQLDQEEVWIFSILVVLMSLVNIAAVATACE